MESPIVVSDDLVCLKWTGPFQIDWTGALQENALGRSDLELKTIQQESSRGLYLVLGDHPSHGQRALLYIGRSEHVADRLRSHSQWLSEQWRGEVYITVVDENSPLEDIEKLLIWAHSPAYNSSSVATRPTLSRKLRIWNCGNYYRILPELSSEHPFYKS